MSECVTPRRGYAHRRMTRKLTHMRNSILWVSPATHVKTSCHTSLYSIITQRMRRVTHINKLRHTCGYFMSHVAVQDYSRRRVPLHEWLGMGWLRLAGSLKLQVSFAKEPYKRDDILQDTYNLKEPTNRGHPIRNATHTNTGVIPRRTGIYLWMSHVTHASACVTPHVLTRQSYVVVQDYSLWILHVTFSVLQCVWVCCSVLAVCSTVIQHAPCTNSQKSSLHSFHMIHLAANWLLRSWILDVTVLDYSREWFMSRTLLVSEGTLLCKRALEKRRYSTKETCIHIVSSLKW